MHVVTTYFKVRRVPGSMFIGEGTLRDKEIRAKEYQTCLARNLASPAVSAVHLLVQDEESLADLHQQVIPRLASPLHRMKLRPVLFHQAPKQPLYSDLFDYANEELDKRVVMVCNADIHLPTSPQGPTPPSAFHQRRPFPVDRLVAEIRQPDPRSNQKRVFALTRYESEHTMDAPLIDDYRGSHDAFIFESPLPRSFPPCVAHQQNCYKAENIVIHELRRAGLAVTNPCLDAQLFHLHEADLRQWMPAVDEVRYGRAWPCLLGASDTGNSNAQEEAT